MVFQRFVFPECSSGRLGRTRSVAYFNVLYCGAAYGSRFVMVAYGAVLQTLITREGRVARRLDGLLHGLHGLHRLGQLA